MSAAKLIGLTVAWVLASITIGVVIGVLVTEILVLIGLVDTGSTEYSISLNIISLSVFVVVGSVPLVFRKRFESSDADNA